MDLQFGYVGVRIVEKFNASCTFYFLHWFSPFFVRIVEKFNAACTFYFLHWFSPFFTDKLPKNCKNFNYQLYLTIYIYCYRDLPTFLILFQAIIVALFSNLCLYMNFYIRPSLVIKYLHVFIKVISHKRINPY